MFNCDSTMKEIKIGAVLDGLFPTVESERFLQEVAGDSELSELLSAVIEVASAAEEKCGEEVPAHLVERAINLHSERPGFIRITLALVGKCLQVLSCPEDLTMYRPVMAEGMRGEMMECESPVIVMAKILDNMHVEVEADRGAGGTDCTLKLTVIPINSQNDINRFRVTLFSRNRELFSGPMENGRMFFEHVRPGMYSLEVCNNGKKIGEIALKLEEGVRGGAGGK